MRPRTHSIALTLLGFTAGAAVVYALDHLPSIKDPPGSSHPTRDASSASSSLGSNTFVSLEVSSVASPEVNSVASSGTSLESAPGFADAVAAAAPAVVKISAAGSLHQESRTSGQDRSELLAPILAGKPFNQVATRLGSGVIIGSQGLIVTNGHVVRDRDQIRVELNDGRTLSAELLGIDHATDLAVLRAPLAGLVPIAFGDPSSLRVGDVVLAIGNPYGIGQTVSLGIVSATGRSQLGLTEIEDFIQTDAAINPGNSGGALVDSTGRLVGIATAGLSESGYSEGVGFAIPVTLVMQVVETLTTESNKHGADNGPSDRGWLGLGGRSVTPDLEQRFGLRTSSGVLVSNLVENGPAAVAGLRAGDVITTFAGQDVTDTVQLRELITATALQGEALLVMWRGSERIEVTVRAAEWAGDQHADLTDAEPNRNEDRATNGQHQARVATSGSSHREQSCPPRRSDC